jgi:hypothetical protein
MVPTTTLIRSIALVVMTPAAQAAGDAKIGERIFSQCKPCHSLGRTRTDRSDPLPSAGPQGGHCRWLQLFGGDAGLRNNLEQRHARKISG